jgi:hypothetical protein
LIRSKLLTAISGSNEGGNIYIGERAFTAPGFYYWDVPLAVTRIHVCCIGAGAYNDYALTNTYDGGGGGGLVWANDIDVTPGDSLLIRVGNPETGTGDNRHSSIGIPKENVQEFDEVFIEAYGGSSSGPGGGYNLQGRPGGGGSGGPGSGPSFINSQLEIWGGSGGGAAGYQGNGGAGIRGGNGLVTNPGTGGGSAGGATFWRDLSGQQNGFKQGGAGGGTGIKGIGADGTGRPAQGSGANPVRGSEGSGGTGPDFGAGGACLYNMSPSVAPDYATAGGGAVRIIWGIKYSYPNNADVKP